MKYIETGSHVDLYDKGIGKIDILSRLFPYAIAKSSDGEAAVQHFRFHTYLHGPVLSPETENQTVELQYGRGVVEVRYDPSTKAYSVGSFGRVRKLADSWVFMPHSGPFFYRAHIPNDEMSDVIFTGMIHIGAALSTTGSK